MVSSFAFMRVPSFLGVSVCQLLSCICASDYDYLACYSPDSEAKSNFYSSKGTDTKQLYITLTGFNHLPKVRKIWKEMGFTHCYQM